MRRIIFPLTAALGLLIMLLSKFQNLLFLFLGLGIFIASLLSLLIKRFARYVFIPFIILLGIFLLILNSINFMPNSYAIDYYSSMDFDDHLLINYGSPDCRDLIVDPLRAMPDLEFDKANLISFVLNKQPILTSDDLILTDYTLTNQNNIISWYWSGDSKWKQINESQYLHIFDPQKNIFYPNAINAFNLDNALNFIVIDSTPENDLSFNEISLNDVYYQTQPSYFNFNSPVKSILLQEESLDEFGHYNVLINGKLLEQEKSDNGIYKYSFDSPVKTIKEIIIVESLSQTSHLDIEAIEPPDLSLFVLESNPQPIIIEKISLFKYLGRLNYFLPFFEWDINMILENFSVKNGSIYIKDDLLYILPDGITSSLDINHSPLNIIQLGLGHIKSYILISNILITVLFLILYTSFTIFLNKYYKTFQMTYHKIFDWFKKKFIPFFHNLNWGPVTPFQIFFSAFLVLCWILILVPFEIRWVRSILIGITLIICSLLVYYMIKDNEI